MQAYIKAPPCHAFLLTTSLINMLLASHSARAVQQFRIKSLVTDINPGNAPRRAGERQMDLRGLIRVLQRDHGARSRYAGLLRRDTNTIKRAFIRET